jgi:carbon storage regulator
MLILQRRIGESIFIGKDHEIEVCVISSSKGEVKLGFYAPTSIPIYRSELLREDNQDDFYKTAPRNVLESSNGLPFSRVL